MPLALMAITLFSVLALQFVRYQITERTLSDVESGHVQVCKYASDTGNFINVYIRPLGLLGYLVFDSEVLMVDSNGNRFVRVCNFYNVQRFHGRLDCLMKRDAASFADMDSDDILCQMARWRSPLWLLFFDFLFAITVCSVFYQIVFLYSKRCMNRRVRQGCHRKVKAKRSGFSE